MNKRPIRIAIAGIGGIGGYLGGKLACHYAGGKQVEVIFIARNEMAGAIIKDGLILHSKGVQYRCIPALVSGDPSAIGHIDIFIICTKNFSVADVVKNYAGCMDENTTVITTQNTVNGKAAIFPNLPQGATLMEGCIYIASNIAKPGVVVHSGGPAKFIFGTEENDNKSGEAIAEIFTDAGIDAAYSTDIKPVLWKKFMFVSPVAIVTALYKITFAEVLEKAEPAGLFTDLTAEVMRLATAKGIGIDDNTIANNIVLLTSFKGEIRSSFQLDLEQGMPTEIDSLISFVTREAKVFGIPTPCYANALVQLIKRGAISIG